MILHEIQTVQRFFILSSKLKLKLKMKSFLGSLSCTLPTYYLKDFSFLHQKVPVQYHIPLETIFYQFHTLLILRVTNTELEYKIRKLFIMKFQVLNLSSILIYLSLLNNKTEKPFSLIGCKMSEKCCKTIILQQLSITEFR